MTPTTTDKPPDWYQSFEFSDQLGELTARCETLRRHVAVATLNKHITIPVNFIRAPSRIQELNIEGLPLGQLSGRASRIMGAPFQCHPVPALRARDLGALQDFCDTWGLVGLPDVPALNRFVKLVLWLLTSTKTTRISLKGTLDQAPMTTKEHHLLETIHTLIAMDQLL